MKRYFIAAALVAALAVPAHSQAVCMTVKTLEDMAKRYGEEITGGGILSGSTARMVILTSPKGTFTLAVIDPTGKACVLYVGTDWQADVPGVKS